jgi:hypothetical protein
MPKRAAVVITPSQAGLLCFSGGRRPKGEILTED